VQQLDRIGRQGGVVVLHRKSELLQSNWFCPASVEMWRSPEGAACMCEERLWLAMLAGMLMSVITGVRIAAGIERLRRWNRRGEGMGR
jgi:hypothetical protein